MTGTISNRDDLIDSRDIQERVDDIDVELDDLGYDPDDEDGPADDHVAALVDERNEWQEVIDQGSAEFLYGETLIRDSYFMEYAQELAEDIGAVKFTELSWPACHIDWTAAADALKIDYMSVEIGDVTYWFRAG